MVKKIFAALVLTCLLAANAFSFEPNKLNNDPKEKALKSKWSLNAVYTELGFGVAATLYKPISKSTDFFTSLTISGIAEDIENEQTNFISSDPVVGKENRVYNIPLSIGIQHKLFSSSLEEGFTPMISAGIAPAMIISTPYEKSFFSAFGDAKAKFAVGPFAGIGMQFKQGSNMSFALDLKYYYLPVIGGSVNSMKDKPINNVGGLQLTLGLNFLGN